MIKLTAESIALLLLNQDTILNEFNMKIELQSIYNLAINFKIWWIWSTYFDSKCNNKFDW